jgi:hypothetical protein
MSIGQKKSQAGHYTACAVNIMFIHILTSTHSIQYYIARSIGTGRPSGTLNVYVVNIMDIHILTSNHSTMHSRNVSLLM